MTVRRGGLRASDLLSVLLNPSALTGIFFVLLAARYAGPGARLILYDAIGVAFTAVIPISVLLFLRSRGLLSDVEMRIRSERALVYRIGVATYGLGTGFLWVAGAPWPLWGLLALHVPNTLVLTVVTRRLKVSVHTMVLTSLAVAAVWFLGAGWAPAVLTVPAAGWARWDAGNHSVKELLCGVLIGAVMTPLELLALQAAFGGRA
jgi:hypothetical protein